MKITYLTLFLMCAYGTSLQAQKTKILLAKKVDFGEMSEKEQQKTDRQLKQEMDTFLGFGLNLSVDKVEETLKAASDKNKKKSAMRFQVGMQLPKFIKTDPPDKVFKFGWDFGVVK